MIVFLIGENSEIINSLVQYITEPEIRRGSSVRTLISQAGQSCTDKTCLAIFDINHPVNNFDYKVALIKSKLPHLTLWALFDSDSISLKNELMRMGFEKIISYKDDLAALISGYDPDRQ